MRKIIAQWLLAVAAGIAIAAVYGIFTVPAVNEMVVLALLVTVVLLFLFGLMLMPPCSEEVECMEKVLAKLEEIRIILQKGGR
jgi:hypothetical protein